MPVKLFSSEFPVWWFVEKSGFPWSGCYVVGVKVFDKSLSRLETLQSTPPFFQLNFLLRLILGEKCQNTFILPWKAFCGNGIIHLNIAEIYEGDIGGQKTCAYFGNQSMK